MSKYNNANTDHYKTAGRDPQGRNNRQHLAKGEFGKVTAATDVKPKPKKKKAA
jgi:hypothetical protein